VIFGYLQSLLVVQKGLPLAYNRDLQEDKPAVFDAANKTQLALEVLASTLDSLSFNAAKMAESVLDDHLFATDVLEYLVGKGISFSHAHEIVGKVIAYALHEEKSLRELSIHEWKRFSKAFDSDVNDLFNANVSVKAKKTFGSTHPGMVKREIRRWEKFLHA
jgi:argininosuccinate lyase